ncbi:choice-of-anchor M domain-containing protein [Trueperella pecoris]|uniref:Choice-of-anchor M domain-containing protein n=1 Tax=Trueperella pecoris TaxID=2733571 RepID=A0A7M1R0P2_9ACTO|nr:choice-of-anchor M domain-containing protein [Trueperella pecoris]QOR47902.1 choice-of-anchor M domain-containing protein [Trueperella pecoris]
MKRKNMWRGLTAVATGLLLTLGPSVAQADLAPVEFTKSANLTIGVDEDGEATPELRAFKKTAHPNNAVLVADGQVLTSEDKYPLSDLEVDSDDEAELSNMRSFSSLSWIFFSKSESFDRATARIKKISGEGDVALVMGKSSEDSELVLTDPKTKGKKYYIGDEAELSFDEDNTADATWVTTSLETYKFEVTVTLSNEGGDQKKALQPFTLTLRPDKEGSSSGLNPGWTKGEDGKAHLRRGHMDVFYATSSSDGKLYLDIKEDITGKSKVRAPDTAVMVMGEDWYVKEGSDVQLPNGETAGYMSPNTAAKNMLAPGWASSDFASDGFTDVSVKFVKVMGPKGSKIAVWRADGFTGQTPILENGKYYIETGSELAITSGGHQHFNWLFTKPGTYTMTAKVMGSRNGQTVDSEEVTYTWRAEGNPTGEELSNEPNEELGGQASEQPGDEGEQPGDEGEQPGDEGEQPGDEGEQPGDQPSEQPDKKLILDHGHVDLFHAATDGGKLVLNTKEDVTKVGTIRPADSFVLKLNDNTKWNVPKEFQDRIAPSGYYLPEHGSKQTEMLFPGWDTMDVRPDFEKVNFEFVGVKGPGKVFLMRNRPGQAGIDSAFTDGTFQLKQGSVIEQQEPGHTHAHWLFEKPGVYTMTVVAKGTPANGGDAVTSNTATYTWLVGSETKLEDISGQSGKQDGQSGKQDGQSGKQDGQSGKQDGQSGKQDGQSGKQDGQSGKQDGQSGKAQLELSEKEVAQGGKLTLKVSGLGDLDKVDVWIHSDPLRLAENVKLERGAASILLTIPADTAVGKHEIHVKNAKGESLGSAELTITEAKKAQGGDSATQDDGAKGTPQAGGAKGTGKAGGNLAWTGASVDVLALLAVVTVAAGVVIRRQRALVD